MRKVTFFAMTLIISMLAFAVRAQAPQAGVYRIQNVGGNSYVKVTGKYDAQLVSSQSAASYISIGIEKKLPDGTYKVNSLASTYGDENTPVEVYDYITKALTLGEIELRRELSTSSEEHIQQAIARMHELVQENAFMRLGIVDGQADTYYAIAVLPTIPEDVVAVWKAKKNPDGNYESTVTGGHTMWDWCIDIVYRYLDEHSGVGGTNAALASKIRNNLKNIKEGHTYMLTVDPDGSFGYIDTEGALTSTNNRAWWKLTPKVNTDNVKDGTYKIHNLGTDKWVSIKSKYYAKPDAEEAAASDIRITFDGEAYGGQKIINLGGTAPDGTNIDIYEYVKKAIFIGKTAIYNVLTQGNGVNPASPENIAYAQDFMETFVKDNAFMCMKPVPGKDDAVYAYAYIPHIPQEVIYQMKSHGAIAEESEEAAWQYGVNYVKQYLQGGTDNTLKTYILANIDKIRPGVTYYLSAHPTDGTFDFAPETATDAQAAADLTDTHYQWGFDVKDVEDDNLTSGTYKVRNVEYENYVRVTDKYYAKPDATEKEASEIHITFAGKLDDGSYKVTNLSSTYTDANGKEQVVDIRSYIDKAIKLGKVAIAAVLSGEDPHVHVADPDNIKYAQQYLEDFVNENAYMRIMPVAGTNYVYAIATIPEIPDEVVEQMYNHGAITENTKEAAWQYGVDYVMHYLDTHGTNSTLASYVRNNLPKIKQGHTYYLSEDPDHTFGYVDAEQFSTTDRTIQWGIDIEQEDQPIESDFYKIHNVGNDRYVKIEGKYYARPNVEDKEDATPIYVTFDGQLEDGSYKITNLSGDNQDIQEYIQHAIELGEGVLRAALPNSSEANINRAIKAMTDFINENAYMRVRPVPGEDSAYYAYVVLPTVPDSIINEWRQKYPGYNGTMRDWAVEKVKEYLNKPGNNTNGKLKAMVLNNIDRLYEGHTYYLRADQDYTFGIGDATIGEVDLSNRYYWWGFADAITGEPASGYYRIRNAKGVGDKMYVNVTGTFQAKPDKTIDEAKSLAGSVIYVGMGKSNKTTAFPVDTLRSQGVNVGDYMLLFNDILAVIAETGTEVITDKLENDPAFANYKKYAGMVEPLVQTLLSSIDLTLYSRSTLTAEGKPAYTLEVNIPDLAEYCDLANDALTIMGKSKDDLVNKLKQLEADATGGMKKIYNIAWRTAQYLDDPQEMWNKLRENAKPYIQSYFIDQGLAPSLGQLVLNSIDRIDYGTTYCLKQDADGSFGFDSKQNVGNDDAAKWVLEPFNEQDPNYDAETYVPFFVKADMDQATVSITGDHGTTGNITAGETYYYTTGYFDFDAKIENADDFSIYTVSETNRVDHANTGSNTNSPYYGKTFVYYLATLAPVSGDVIPAQTPVVIRCATAPAEADEPGFNINIRPIGKPEHPAVETGDFSELKEEIRALLRQKLGLDTNVAGAPRRVISNTTDNNLLVGSFLGDKVESGQENNYLELSNKTKTEDLESGDIILNMGGLGMWKNNVTELEGNKAYLKGVEDNKVQANFHYDTTFEEGTVGDAPGYIFQFEDGTMTAVKDITATKTVKSVRYYNVAGIESTQPFDGINIVVTTFTDGTKSTVKILK